MAVVRAVRTVVDAGIVFDQPNEILQFLHVLSIESLPIPRFIVLAENVVAARLRLWARVLAFAASLFQVLSEVIGHENDLLLISLGDTGVELEGPIGESEIVAGAIPYFLKKES